LHEAERLYRQILAFDPCHADSLHLLGVIAQKAGRHADAIDMIRRAITINPHVPSYHSNLGNLLMNQGRAEEAGACHRRAAKTLNTRGKALRQRHRPADALASYDAALALWPDYAEALNNRGNALLDLDRPQEALASYDRALALDPGYVEAQTNRGNALRALDRPEEALASYETARALRPYDPGVLINHGNALRDLDRPTEALSSYDRALALQPDYPEVLNNRGAVLRDLHRPAEALASFDQALALRPGFAETWCNKGLTLTELGRLDEATRAIETAVRIAPGNARYCYNFAISVRSAAGDPHLRAMEEMAADMASLNVADRIYLHFALGKAFADIGEQERSFRHLLDGNALKRRQIHYDESAVLMQFERTRAAFTGELVRQCRGAGDPSRMPIFILGMPRSGSTLVEQILASHPKVFGAGEIDDLERAIAAATPDGPPLSRDQLHRLGAEYVSRISRTAPGDERITNKTPENFRFAGLIHLALPNARIIHTRRDPVDTCLSCFSHLFVRRLHYTYDLGELGRYYRAYESLMAHWRSILPPDVMLDLHYEDLVGDPEGQAMRIIAHCGLDWDPRCLDFHRTERTVRTASTIQVRQPIYSSAVGRWRAVEPFLGPLLAALTPSDVGAH
jgi:tetratricopeptide (TPR) repeat protein